MRISASLIVCVLAAVGGVGAGAAPTTRPAGPDPQAGRRAGQAHLTRILVDAYERIGRKDEKWNAPAREVLRWAADLSPRGYTDPAILTAARRAIAAGCDDPAVLYACALALGREHNEPEVTRATVRAASLLAESGYDPFLKAGAQILAVGRIMNFDRRTEPDRHHEARRHADAAFALWPAVLRDPGCPDAHVVAQAKCFQQIYRVLGDPPIAAHERVRALLAQARPNSVALHSFSGDFYVTYAWDARGRNWASTVTPEGWRLFQERLAVARRELTTAWELDPSDPLAPTEMITVCMGEGAKRDEMETWFSRAMAADPDNVDACSRKRLYLEPKWGGTSEAMLEFGRECVRSGRWAALLPFALVDAHGALAGNLPLAKRGDYYRTPGVWAEMQAVFDEYLKRFPSDTYRRNLLAKYACEAEQWAIAGREFDLIGEDSEPDLFCEMMGFAQARQKARAQLKALEKAPSRPATATDPATVSGGGRGQS